MKAGKNRGSGIARSVVLLMLGVVYLSLVAATFVFGLDLASDKTMQDILHVTVILSAIAYLLFVDMIYGLEKDELNGRPALFFAALFTLPVLIGRGIGLAAVSFSALSVPGDILNFYAGVSVSRTVELVGWTTFFPLSMVFLARLFFKKRVQPLAWLCLLSSVCCFVAFLSIILPNIIFTMIGVSGWGIQFLLIVIAYLAKQIHKRRETTAK